MSDIFEILGPVVDITSHEIDELKHELKNKTQELYEMQGELLILKQSKIKLQKELQKINQSYRVVSTKGISISKKLLTTLQQLQKLKQENSQLKEQIKLMKSSKQPKQVHFQEVTLKKKQSKSHIVSKVMEELYNEVQEDNCQNQFTSHRRGHIFGTQPISVDALNQEVSETKHSFRTKVNSQSTQELTLQQILKQHFQQIIFGLNLNQNANQISQVIESEKRKIIKMVSDFSTKSERRERKDQTKSKNYKLFRMFKLW